MVPVNPDETVGERKRKKNVRVVADGRAGDREGEGVLLKVEPFEGLFWPHSRRSLTKTHAFLYIVYIICSW
jgi:hypothetical protein